MYNDVYIIPPYYIMLLITTYLLLEFIYNISFLCFDLRISAPKCPDTSSQPCERIHSFPILDEPIKIRLVHGPTSRVLGDDSPIICHCFFFHSRLELVAAVDLRSLTDTYSVLRGGKPNTVGFWNQRPWLQLSIA